VITKETDTVIKKITTTTRIVLTAITDINQTFQEKEMTNLKVTNNIKMILADMKMIYFINKFMDLIRE
jgi:hypothetical protein